MDSTSVAHQIGLAANCSLKGCLHGWPQTCGCGGILKQGFLTSNCKFWKICLRGSYESSSQIDSARRNKSKIWAQNLAAPQKVSKKYDSTGFRPFEGLRIRIWSQFDVKKISSSTSKLAGFACGTITPKIGRSTLGKSPTNRKKFAQT